MSAERAGRRPRRKSRPGSTAAGFTLLEVVVALAIAALALVGLFQAGSGALGAVDTAGRVEEAVERARSHLAAFAVPGALRPARTAGDDGGGYRWEVEARQIARQEIASQPDELEAAGTTQALYAVVVTISWRSGGRTRSVVLETRRLGSAAAAE